MKKSVLALSMTGMLLSSAIQADTILGIYAGADAWRTAGEGHFGQTEQVQKFNFKDKTQGSYYVALEHPIPVLPNIRIQHTPLKTNGETTLSTDLSLDGQIFPAGTMINNQVDLTSTDYILYYEILDNGLVSIDLGINAKNIKGDVYVEDINTGFAQRQNGSEFIPLIYASTIVGLPLTGLEFFANGNYVSYDGNRVYDAQAGVAYALLDNIAVDLRLKAGYRAFNLTLDDVDNLYTDLDFTGAFLGVELHF